MLPDRMRFIGRGSNEDENAGGVRDIMVPASCSETDFRACGV